MLDVVGQDGDESGFVVHTGLAGAGGSQETAKISVFDMGPPLHGQSAPGHLRADVVGSAALTDDEVHKITVFIDRHAGEHSAFLQLRGRDLLDAAPQMYVVRPHAKAFYEEDGRYARCDLAARASWLKRTRRRESAFSS